MRASWGWEALATYIGYNRRAVIRIPLPHWYNLSNFSIYKCVETNTLIITADAEPYKNETMTLKKTIELH